MKRCIRTIAWVVTLACGSALAATSTVVPVKNLRAAKLVKTDSQKRLTSAAASDVVAAFGPCTGAQYLGADGACHTPASPGSASLDVRANGVSISSPTSAINFTGGIVGSLTGSTTATIAIAGPWNAYPSQLASGSGTEASPWTHADNTAGIQSAINSLESVRGGRVTLSPGRYDVSTTIQLSSPAITLSGEAAGFSANPNALAEGPYATKLHRLSGSGAILNIGHPTFAYRAGGVYVENLYMVGTSTDPLSAPYMANAAITFGNADQPKLKHVNILNFGVGVNLSTTTVDAGTMDDFSILGNGMGIYSGPTADVNYLNVLNSRIGDNWSYGIFLATQSFTSAGGVVLQGNTIVRNCMDSALCPIDPANVLWGAGSGMIIGNNIGYGGEGTVSGADGLVVRGDTNTITGNHFFQQHIANSAAVRIYGNNNYVGGNVFRNNDTAIVVYGNNNVIGYNSYANNAFEIKIQPGATNNIVVSYGARITDLGTGTTIIGVPTVLEGNSAISSESNNAMLRVVNDYTGDASGHASLLLKTAHADAKASVVYQNGSQPLWSVGVHGGTSYGIQDAVNGGMTVVVEQASLSDTIHTHNAGNDKMYVGVNNASPVAALDIKTPGGDAMSYNGHGAAYLHCTSAFCGLDIGAPAGSGTFLEYMENTTKKGALEWSPGDGMYLSTAGSFTVMRLTGGNSLTVDSSGNMALPVTGVSQEKALCLGTGGKLGTCSTAVDSSGGCACVIP